MPHNDTLPAEMLARLLFALILTSAIAAPAEPPVIPTGLDAYRQWARWPYQRIGERAYMRSTYDRRGGNEGADASHFLYQLADDYNVTLDVQGPGILYFVRYNHWHGSPWHYEVDGADTLVRETSTADPVHPAANSVFLPERLFPTPLVFTWAQTRGADLSWAPIAFEKSFRMGYSRTFYGTGYYIYHLFTPGAKVSQPIAAWNAKAEPDPAVLSLIDRAGTDIAPAAGVENVRLQSGKLNLTANAKTTVWSAPRGPAILRALEFSLPKEQAQAFGAARLRVRWDHREQPSIDTPVALFFGAGILYNRDNREFLVKSFPMVIRYSGDRVYLSCYFPMPYFRSAEIELIAPPQTDITGIEWKIRYAPFRDPSNQVGYFHATYQDHPQPAAGKDLVLLDTRRTEGGGSWSGSFVGTSFIFSHDAVLNTLEGDPRFFFDDSRTPQAQGTGTEEWGGGGDYWGGENMTLPFAGHPLGAKSAKDAVSAEDKIESAYRFLLADLMPFGKNARIQLEHGGTNESTQHYETIVYWYGLPEPSLIETDQFQIGDGESELSHHYLSPDASAPYEITSRYEWGPDTLQGKEIYPAERDRGRTTKTFSEFTLRIDAKNIGVLLRRKLDYSYPNQRAEVFVADPRAAKPIWKPAGMWYLAGSNTCVYSNPGTPKELGATQHNVQTSNRRFRDDEFLLPRTLTAGLSAIRVRVQFAPVSVPLYPGYPIPELAWSEISYAAYSYVMPNFRP
jgi:hypothetical protein